MADTNDGAALRRALVEELCGQGLLRAGGSAEAFLAVPRERFLPEVARRQGLRAVYVNDAIVTRRDARGAPISSSSQPAVMAVMLDLLRPLPGQRVLEIGAGTGYNAALLAAIVGERGRVTTVEIDPETGESARAALAAGGPGAPEVVVGDGRGGWPPSAPYDRIIVTASSTEVPRAWYEQLADGGILVLPLLPAPGAQQAQVIVALRRGPAGLEPAGAARGGFMELRSGAGAANRVVCSLSASEVGGEQGQGQVLVQLSGSSLEALAAPRRRQLLALTLGAPRARRLREPAPLWSLATFLSVAAPQERLLQLYGRHGYGIGVLERQGRGLAVVAAADETATRLLAWGAAEPAVLLARLLGEWRALGRPDPERLRVGVRFGIRPRRHHWRTLRRPDSLLEVDWEPPAPVTGIG